MQTMPFDDWVLAWFDHPDDWECACDFPSVELSPAATLAYTTQLFQNAGTLLAAYSDTQVGKGLHALIWEGDSPLTVLHDTSLSRTECRACVKSIYRVYKEIFALRCPEVRSAKARGELSHVCFMWWDIFPLYDTAHPALNETVLTTLERTLALPHLACQEAALHGLGHWQRANPARVQGIIDTFLSTQKRHRPELVSYAQNARCGRVL